MTAAVEGVSRQITRYLDAAALAAAAIQHPARIPGTRFDAFGWAAP
jgi:hypothetical protein